MIPVKVALAFDRLKDQKSAPPLSLNIEQEIDLDYVDSIVESLIFAHFVGKMFAVPVPAKFASVLDALAARYETGGWSVGIFPQRQGDVVTEILLALAPRGEVAHAATTPSNELPPLETPFIAPAVTATTKRLLVRMPTRGRPAQALRVLADYRSMAGMPITLEVVIDEDDETMLAAPALQRMNALGCVITVGKHESKIEAVNGGRVTEWDVLLLASDDMQPVQQGWAVEVMRAMEEHWPHLDGAIYQDDSYAHKRCVTLPIIGKRFYDQFGFVYEHEYASLVCDVEQHELWTAMGRLIYVDRALITHKHPAAGQAAKDALYERNDALHSADQAVYEKRKSTVCKHSQFRFDAPPLWMTICIATVPERRAQLERLLDEIYAQIIRDAPRQVEVIVDAGAGNIGEKRQRMLEKARGHFVASADDDDLVSHDYIARVVGALRENPDADCASLVGTMTTFGNLPQKFEHDLKHTEWKQEGTLHVRPPNHLNAVRRELALQVGFVSATKGEDHEFSKALHPLLKKQASTGDAPLYYYFCMPRHAK